jgi:hypothetical protein
MLKELDVIGDIFKNDISKLLELWNKNRAIEESFSWFTPVNEIIKNDYILSANAYNLYVGGEEKEYRELKEILREINKTAGALNIHLQKLKNDIL